MPFFRSLPETAPGYNADIPWPIDGLVYVIAFAGGMSGGAAAGFVVGRFIGLAVGLTVGVAVTFGIAWLSDRFVDAWIARFQLPLQRRTPRILINIAAFSWAVGVCAISVLATLGILSRIQER